MAWSSSLDMTWNTKGFEGVPHAGQIKLSVRHRQYIAAVPFPQFTLILVQAGNKRVAGNGMARIDADAGSLLAIASGSVLTLENLPPAQGRYEALCIEIETGLARAVASELASIDPTPPVHCVPRPRAYLDEALARLAQGLGDESLPAAVLTARVAEVIAGLEAEGVPVWPMCRPSLAERVRRCLAADLTNPPSPVAVARGLHLSAPTLRRHLATEKTSYSELLSDLRLSAGLAWIQGGDTPIAQVAERCGYASASRFAERFRARFGVTPSALRNGERARTASD